VKRKPLKLLNLDNPDEIVKNLKSSLENVMKEYECQKELIENQK
jgi:hypothetical protein